MSEGMEGLLVLACPVAVILVADFTIKVVKKILTFTTNKLEGVK